MTRYTVFGATVASNRPLRGLASAPADAAADVRVDFAAGEEPVTDPAAREVPEPFGWRAIRREPDGGRVFLCASCRGARAWSIEVSGDGATMEVRWTGGVDPADLAILVQSSAIPAALALKGVPLLHACSIDVGGRAVLVLGAGGTGKSTAAAAAVVAGYAVLADDVAALSVRGDGVYVHPGPARLKVHEETALALGRRPWAMHRLWAEPAMEPKRYVDLSASDATFCEESRRVAALHVLTGRRPFEPRIDPLRPAAALPHLLRSTYAGYATDRAQQAALLSVWTRLAEEVPVYELTPADDIAAMPSLMGMLAAWAGAA